MDINILVSDKLSDRGIQILKDAGMEVDIKTGMSPDELKACIGKYDGIIIRSATKLTSEILECADNLKIIGRAGSGLDNVDKDFASKRGIIVMNTPGGNTVTTAEHAISMMLSLARYIPQANASMKQGKWEKKRFMGREICGKTLGIIGLGNIGTEVAKRAVGLKMKVIAYDPYTSPEKASDLQVTLVELDGLFSSADIITVHTPLTDDTRYIIRKETIGKMKDGVMIINCARGGIIKEEDLAQAIEEGKVSGAAIDVYEKEPPDPDNPLLSQEKTICTPHLGASTKEAQENVAIAIANQFVDYFTKGLIRNAVNVPSVSCEVLAELEPFMNLGERLGAMISQLIEGQVMEAEISFKGDIAKKDTTPVSTAILLGFLKPAVGDEVNSVNAPFLIKERGIRVIEKKDESIENYNNLITIKVKTDKEETSLSGVVRDKKDIRLVEIDGFTVEAIPEGYILVFSNLDKPGVIGNIGRVLGDNNINIAGMQFGREEKGGKAVSLINIDSPVDNKIISELSALPNVNSVKMVTV